MFERLEFNQDQDEYPTIPMVIPGLLPRGIVALLAGPPACGKTMLWFQAAVALALGRPFLGQVVGRPLATVLLPFEDPPHSILRRQAACLQHYAGESQVDAEDMLRKHFHVLRFKADAERPETFEKLAGGISDYLDFLVKKKIEPGLVVVDPLSQVIVGDENDAKSFRVLFDVSRWLAEKFNVTILFIHHTRKTATDAQRKGRTSQPIQESLRGSSAIAAGARLVLAMVPRSAPGTGSAAGSILRAELVVAKSNDSPTGVKMHLVMDPETGIWRLDDAPVVQGENATSRTGHMKKDTRRYRVLKIMASQEGGNNRDHRLAAMGVFRDEVDPGGSLRGALRDLRTQGYLNANDEVTELGHKALDT